MAAHHHLGAKTCLRTSLVLQTLLLRRGIQTELRIGVRKLGSELCAHAWLEYAGAPIGQPGDIATSFLPLAPAHPQT